MKVKEIVEKRKRKRNEIRKEINNVRIVKEMRQRKDS